jgi:hypothetical protein
MTSLAHPSTLIASPLSPDRTPRPVSPSEGSQNLRMMSLGNVNQPATYTHPAANAVFDVPLHVSSQLFQAYFRCIHPIWPILYKPLYSSLNHEQILELLPKSLVYAILSLVVLIQGSGDDRQLKHDQANHFFNEALRTLETLGSPQYRVGTSVLKPSIAKCQVYTILALQQHGIGNFSEAGTLCAIAASMAIDRSLHRTSDKDDQIEAQVKSRLWWNVYVLETMLSSEMGKPALLRAEEADTPFPSVEESDEYELYSEGPQAHGNLDGHSPLKLRTISAFHTTVQMAMIMEKVSRQIYSIAARKMMFQDHAEGERTRLRLWHEIQEYEEEMEKSPLKLEKSGKSAPVIVTNYAVRPSFNTNADLCSFCLVYVVHNHLTSPAIYGYLAARNYQRHVEKSPGHMSRRGQPHLLHDRKIHQVHLRFTV